MTAEQSVRTPTLNRERVQLLRDVHAGKVYRTTGGYDMRLMRAGQNMRVDRRLRELREAGWVELTDGRGYRLTEVGVMALSAVT